MFRKLLIANRGEIACRIIRTARKMGIMTTALYSTADEHSLHVREADEAFFLGPSPASESYLNIAAIIALAKACGAEAIHPGYGFLSENPDFARACEAAGIVFIGPSVSALEIMGSKILAKQHLAHSSVPLIPGYHGDDQSDARLLTEALKMGFPILIKAANGGGGKGMREVMNQSEFSQALAAARREAKASFADDTMLLEKLIQNPRHIEIQIMADNFGHVVHLFERDCSIQRRHQKVIEEAPANHLPAPLRQRLTNAASTVAKTIDYRGAGTVECLVDEQGDFYFMEMNTRLQVEHPVTELITGIDLVAWQIMVAANLPLPLTQDDIQARGHAIECRLYAEDPQHEFIPSIGDIRFLRLPEQQHLRIDTGIEEHSSISMYYDAMIAKLITWGETREDALMRMQEVLKQCHIGGIKTNRTFLQAILAHPLFVNNTFNTGFLSDNVLVIPKANLDLVVSMAGALDYLALTQALDPLEQATFGWQMHLTSQWDWHYRCGDTTYHMTITPHTLHQCTLILAGDNASPQTLTLTSSSDTLWYDDGQQIQHVFYEKLPKSTLIYTQEGPIEVTIIERLQPHTQTFHASQLTAPMPGTVVAILKKPGETVAQGEALIVMEAMKMEHTIRAPSAGTVQSLFYEVGAQVQEGATLIALEPL